MMLISVTIGLAFLVLLGLAVCQSLEIDNLRYEIRRLKGTAPHDEAYRIADKSLKERGGYR
jgi:hypothetical protein